jgi:hypothetical protein
MMFDYTTQNIMEEDMRKDNAFNFFRRNSSVGFNNNGDALEIRTALGSSYHSALSITVDEWHKITKAMARTNEGASFRSFFIYHHLKDTGRLKVWFDKVRSLGSSTKFYA